MTPKISDREAILLQAIDRALTEGLMNPRVPAFTTRAMTAIVKSMGLTYTFEDVSILLDRMGVFRSDPRTLTRATPELLAQLPQWLQAAERVRESVSESVKETGTPGVAPHYYPIR